MEGEMAKSGNHLSDVVHFECRALWLIIADHWYLLFGNKSFPQVTIVQWLFGVSPSAFMTSAQDSIVLVSPCKERDVQFDSNYAICSHSESIIWENASRKMLIPAWGMAENHRLSCLALISPAN